MWLLHKAEEFINILPGVNQTAVNVFCSSDKGQCLINTPSEQLLVKPQFRRFPPQQINSDEQCVLQFGETSSMCKPAVSEKQKAV